MENGGQVFHVISRVVDKRKIFGEEEKYMFWRMMRQFEAFSGVEVYSYCLMGNHFHLLLHVPCRPTEISVEDVRERMKHIYDKDQMSLFDARLREMKDNGDESFEKDFYDRMRARMFNLSAFVKDLKQKFTMWYNYQNGRKGTLWEQRFKSMLVQGNPNAMMKTAAYIELNPVRAGIVDHPEQYKWCSFAEAKAGNKKAKAGIIKLATGFGAELTWKEASTTYSQFFMYTLKAREAAESYQQNTSNSNNDEHSQSPNSPDFRNRVRAYTEGFVLGSRKFIEEFYHLKKDHLQSNRKKICYKLKDRDKVEIHSYRNVT